MSTPNELEVRFYETRFESNTKKVSGLGIPFYDGTPGTEFQLAPNVFERYAPDCFDGSMSNVKLLLMHDRRQPLARTPKTLRLTKDKRGIHFDADLIATRSAQDAIELLQGDYIQGSSAGFLVHEREYKKDGTKNIVIIKRATLSEISLVDDAAYQGTTASLRSFEEWQKNASIEAYEERLARILAS